MVFGKLRRRSKSSSIETKLEILSSVSADSDAPNKQTKTTDITNPSTPSDLSPPEKPDGAQDFASFVDETKREEERGKRERLRAIKEAEKRKRDCNMSPWAGRM